MNLQEEDGFAPLHVSCQNGHVTVVEILLKAKAEPNLMARSTSWQALHYAAQVKFVIVFNELTDQRYYGVAPDITQNYHGFKSQEWSHLTYTAA